MMKNINRICTVLYVAIIIVGCSSTLGINPAETLDPCSPSEVVKYIDSLDDVYRQFEEVQEQALKTPRDSLYSKVENLQSIQRKAENIGVPPCAETAKSYLVEYMELINDAFSSFLYEAPEEDIQTSYYEAALRHGYYMGAMDELRSLAAP